MAGLLHLTKQCSIHLPAHLGRAKCYTLAKGPGTHVQARVVSARPLDPFQGHLPDYLD